MVISSGRKGHFAVSEALERQSATSDAGGQQRAGGRNSAVWTLKVGAGAKMGAFFRALRRWGRRCRRRANCYGAKREGKAA